MTIHECVTPETVVDQIGRWTITSDGPTRYWVRCDGQVVALGTSERQALNIISQRRQQEQVQQAQAAEV